MFDGSALLRIELISVSSCQHVWLLDLESVILRRSTTFRLDLRAAWIRMIAPAGPAITATGDIALEPIRSEFAASALITLGPCNNLAPVLCSRLASDRGHARPSSPAPPSVLPDVDTC